MGKRQFLVFLLFIFFSSSSFYFYGFETPLHHRRDRASIFFTCPLLETDSLVACRPGASVERTWTAQWGNDVDV